MEFQRNIKRAVDDKQCKGVGIVIERNIRDGEDGVDILKGAGYGVSGTYL